MNRQKYLILILFLLGLFSLFRYWPEIGQNMVDVDSINEASDVSAWPTYRNEQYGFTMKYPKGWRVSEGFDEPIPGRLGPMFKTHYINFYSGKDGYDSLEIYEANTEEVLKFFMETGGEPRYVVVGKEKHGQIEMTKYRYNFTANDDGAFYNFEHNNLVYNFFPKSKFAYQILDSLVFVN